MKVRNTSFLLSALLAVAAFGQSKSLSLSVAEQKEIAQIVLEQGLKDSKPSPADNCSAYFLKGAKVLFLSAKNLPAGFKPKLSGFHLIVESETEIERNIIDGKKHCWMALSNITILKKRSLNLLHQKG